MTVDHLQLLHGILFTFVYGVLGCYNLFLYFIVRKKIYINFCLFVFGVASHNLLPAAGKLYPVWLSWIENTSVITAMIAILGILLFTRSFLGVDKENYPVWEKLFSGMKVATVLIICVQATNMIVANSTVLGNQLAMLASLDALVVIFLALITAVFLFKKEKAARLFLVTTTPLMLAAIAFTLIWYLSEASQVEKEQEIHARYLISSATTFQMVLFSVFVGYKLKNTEHEMLRLQKNANQMLEEEVKRQTRSLMHAKEAIEAQRDKLKKVNKLKNKLFSLVSHDLKNPLQQMVGLLNLLENQMLSSDKGVILTRTMKIGLSQNITVIERLLQWSYQQLDGIQVKKEQFDIEELFHEVNHELKLAQESKHLTIDAQFEATALTADKDMMKVVVRNLLSNAIKFSHEEGHIHVHTKRGKRVILTIADQGIGMNPQWYESLIQSGEPVSTPGTKGEKGKGFGLLITKDFVEMNGGTMACESEDGSGTVFEVSFPA